MVGALGRHPAAARARSWRARGRRARRDRGEGCAARAGLTLAEPSGSSWRAPSARAGVLLRTSDGRAEPDRDRDPRRAHRRHPPRRVSILRSSTTCARHDALAPDRLLNFGEAGGRGAAGRHRQPSRVIDVPGRGICPHCSASIASRPATATSWRAQVSLEVRAGEVVALIAATGPARRRRCGRSAVGCPAPGPDEFEASASTPGQCAGGPAARPRAGGAPALPEHERARDLELGAATRRASRAHAGDRLPLFRASRARRQWPVRSRAASSNVRHRPRPHARPRLLLPTSRASASPRDGEAIFETLKRSTRPAPRSCSSSRTSRARWRSPPRLRHRERAHRARRPARGAAAEPDIKQRTSGSDTLGAVSATKSRPPPRRRAFVRLRAQLSAVGHPGDFRIIAACCRSAAPSTATSRYAPADTGRIIAFVRGSADNPLPDATIEVLTPKTPGDEPALLSVVARPRLTAAGSSPARPRRQHLDRRVGQRLVARSHEGDDLPRVRRARDLEVAP